MSGQLLETLPQRPSEIRYHGRPDDTHHPVSVRWVSGRLWSLDAWSQRIAEHAVLPPFALLQTWTVEGVQPVDMTWDGESLWVLDREEQILARLSPDDPSLVEQRIVLPAGWDVSAVDYEGDSFWGYDESSQKLIRFTAPPVRVQEEFVLGRHRRPSDVLSGLAVDRRFVWTVSEKSQSITRWSRRRLSLQSLL